MSIYLEEDQGQAEFQYQANQASNQTGHQANNEVGTQADNQVMAPGWSGGAPMTNGYSSDDSQALMENHIMTHTNVVLNGHARPNRRTRVNPTASAIIERVTGTIRQAAVLGMLHTLDNYSLMTQLLALAREQMDEIVEMGKEMEAMKRERQMMRENMDEVEEILRRL